MGKGGVNLPLLPCPVHLHQTHTVPPRRREGCCGCEEGRPYQPEVYSGRGRAAAGPPWGRFKPGAGVQLRHLRAGRQRPPPPPLRRLRLGLPHLLLRPRGGARLGLVLCSVRRGPAVTAAVFQEAQRHPASGGRGGILLSERRNDSGSIHGEGSAEVQLLAPAVGLSGGAHRHSQYRPRPPQRAVSAFLSLFPVACHIPPLRNNLPLPSHAAPTSNSQPQACPLPRDLCLVCSECSSYA
mmetsp:Transcript_37727/g.106609  ORF Transcript_37727/g.106609 Transcript_37727/m.106609 type:complete len:239 (-) Transcript_37727:114-830(-)